MTTKVIEFTNEQKSLIWNTKIAPAKGTEHEAQAFLSVCEEYGLNPLLGDIIFQRFETKYGPRVSYLITRDAYRKYAMRQDDFHNMVSGVVKEGDYFEVDAVAGVPIHKFGNKRGPIVGAWAVVKSKSRGNTVKFADFQEYHKSLSQKNGVWNSMPSAMIEKVAESMALRASFPLGVIFSSEDEVGLTDTVEPIVQTNQAAAQPAQPSIQEELAKAKPEQKETKPKEESKTKPAKTEKQEKVAPPIEETPAVAKVEETPVVPTVAKEEVAKEVVEQTPVVEETKQEGKVETPQKQEPVAEVTQEVTEGNVYQFVKGVLGSSPQGSKFLRVYYVENGVQKEAFAREDEKIALFDEFEEGTTSFKGDFQEVNGFNFVLSAQAV